VAELETFTQSTDPAPLDVKRTSASSAQMVFVRKLFLNASLSLINTSISLGSKCSVPSLYLIFNCVNWGYPILFVGHTKTPRSPLIWFTINYVIDGFDYFFINQ